MFPRNLRNRFDIARSYLLRRTRLEALPFELQIGITNRCNLNCVFCPHRFSKRPQGVISLELLDHLLAQAAPYVDTVDLSFDGEPFIHPRWVECVQTCHRHAIYPMLETNALLMDEALAREVLSVGLGSITFSIDAATRDTYAELKPGGDYDRMVVNVERFLKLARREKKRPYIQLQFVRTPENTHEAELFLRQWKGKGADVVHIKPMLNFAGSCGPRPAHPAKRPCLFLWSSLTINWDGTVPLCCLEIEGRTLMGDATSESLLKIADNEAFQAVRRLHATGRYIDHPICRNCDVPSVAWPFVAGSALVGDLTRRKLINFLEGFMSLNK